MEIKLKASSYKYKISGKDLIKNFFDINLGSVITDIVSIGLDLEMKAFTLLYNTATKTNIQLAKNLNQDKVNKNSDVIINSNIASDIRSFLEEDIIITEDFFYNVIKYNPNYLIKSFNVFKKFTELLEIILPMDYEYEYYLTYRKNLSDEYTINKNRYIDIAQYFDMELRKGDASFREYIEYLKKIKSNFTNSIRPNDITCRETLKDLYVAPYFQILNRNLKNSDGYNFFVKTDKPITIHEFLSKYFFSGLQFTSLKENYSMVFILGQPGQGKTSFCYKTIYEILMINNGLPQFELLFVKIRDLIAVDFVKSPFEEINKLLKINRDFSTSKIVLILDGLDEAYMGGGITDNDLRLLYERLNKACRNNKQLKIILTSRANYLNVNEPCLDGTLVLQLQPFDDKQILEYASNFKSFYPKNKFIKKIRTILRESEYSHIKELLQQAVVIYFIAIADINVQKGDSKSIIYSKLFSILSKRAWDENGQLDYINPKVKGDHSLYEKYLREYIRNIAFEIFQSPNLFITLERLIDLQSTKNFIKKCFTADLINSPEKIKDISKYLLISFYFQESKNENAKDTAIEFFHNSLWEYLTAEYMWEENKKILLQKDEDDDLLYVSKESYFGLLYKLIGKKEFTYSVFENLQDIISNEDTHTNNLIAIQSKNLFYSIAKDDFLLYYNKMDSIISPLKKSISIFELFWTFYSTSNLISNEYISVSENVALFFCKLSNMFTIDYKLKNLAFNDNGSEIFLLDSNELINVIFDDELTNCTINMNNFFNCTIEVYLENTMITNNKFFNTTFNNSIVGSNVIWKNNIFKDYNFKSLKFYSQSELDNFLSENSFDVAINENHGIEKRAEIRYKNIIQEVFYIESV